MIKIECKIKAIEHRTDCCAWTTKVVGNTVIVSLQLYLGFLFAGVVRRNGGRFLFVF